MPTALVNGVRLSYLQMEQGGDGAREELVMVHGLATNMAFWYLPYAFEFSRRFRVTLFDLRGLGRSEMTPSGYAPRNLALDLAGLLDHLGIARSHFVAHSFGGVVALSLACSDASRVQSLVLCDTHISAVRHQRSAREWSKRSHVQALIDRHGLKLDLDDPYFGYRLLTEVAHLQLRRAEVAQPLLDLVGPLMGRNGKRTAAQWVRLMDETTAEFELMGDDGLSLDALRRLSFPILALYGENSQALQTGGALLDAWPHAEFRRIRDAGHFFPSSRSADVMAECERFWRGEYPRRPVVRSGEAQRRHFRSERVFEAQGEWHFATREHGRVGPFTTREEAHDALMRCLCELVIAV